MAQIYNPWQVYEEQDITEHGFVSPVYADQADTLEDTQEGEVDSPESVVSEDGNMSTHSAMMQQALQTINKQSELIAQFMQMFTKDKS